MDDVPLLSIVKDIEEKYKAIETTLVITHSSKDLNIDHKQNGSCHCM